MTLVAGITNAFPIFLPPLLDEFGGSRAVTAGTAGLIWLGGGVLGPLAGRLVDRGDPRLVISAGLIATALGLVGASFAPTLAVFTIVLGVGAGIGVGLTGFVPQAAVISDTYRRRRGFALGIAFSGSMVGFALATPAQWAITAVGWRWTLIGWSAIVALLIPAVLVWYPPRLHGTRASAVATAAPMPATGVTRTVPFWILVLLTTLAPTSGMLVTTQHAVYFNALGFPRAEVAAMLLLGGVLSTVGRALAGLASDRVGVVSAAVASYVLSLGGTLAILATVWWPTRALAYTYVVLLFVAIGTRAIFVPVLVARIAPPGRFGAVFGLLIVGNSVGAALGPFVSGAIYDLSRSYVAIYVVAVVTLLVGIAALAAFVRMTAYDASGPERG